MAVADRLTSCDTLIGYYCPLPKYLKHLVS